MKIYRSNRMLTMDRKWNKTAADDIIGAFLLIYSLVSQIYTVSMFGRTNQIKWLRLSIWLLFIFGKVTMVVDSTQTKTVKSLISRWPSLCYSFIYDHNAGYHYTSYKSLVESDISFFFKIFFLHISKIWLKSEFFIIYEKINFLKVSCIFHL